MQFLALTAGAEESTVNEPSNPRAPGDRGPTPATVALRVRGGKPLDPREANGGFSERGETVFIASAPKDSGMRLIVDDEPLDAGETADGAICWKWTPGFFAGEVRARLTDASGKTIATYRLDVGPAPEKLGGEVFERMVEEILDFDAALLLGEEPAKRKMGAVGPTDDPLVLFERLRSRREPLDAAITAVRRDPATVLRPRRRFVPLREVRRADLRTLRAALGNRAALESLPAAREHRPDTATCRPTPGISAEPIFDTPAVERTVDSPANRAALLMLRALIRRAGELPKRLRELADRQESDTRTALAARLPERVALLGEMERAFRAAERRPPFSQVTRAEVTAAGLNAISAHPIYSRFWQTAWAALRPGVYGLDRNDLLPLAPTWEIYERWCFVALAKHLRKWHPKWDWTSRGQEGSDRRRVVGRGADGVALTLHLQSTFRNTWGVPGENGWAVSRERRPDLLLTRSRDGRVTDFVLLDSKYTAKNLLNEIGDTAHAYQDSLRWGQGLRPAATLILAPTVEGVKSGDGPWLADESYIREHRVGAVAMRPDFGPPDWLEKFLLRPPPPLTHASPRPAPS